MTQEKKLENLSEDGRILVSNPVSPEYEVKALPTGLVITRMSILTFTRTFSKV